MEFCLANTADGYKLVLWGQFHLKMTPNTVFGQVALNISGWKLNSAAIIGGGDDVFCDTLINAEKLVITQVKPETDVLITGHNKHTVPVEKPAQLQQINVDFVKRQYGLPKADDS